MPNRKKPKGSTTHRLALSATFVILAVLIVYADSLIYVASSDHLINSEQENNGVFNNLEKEKVDEVNRDVFSYLRGKSDYIQTDLLNEKEKTHMADVKGIFSIVSIIRLLGLIALITIAFFERQNLSRLFLYASIAIIAVFILFALSALFFGESFTIMHQIFFTNDLWQMEPGVDTLYLYYPEGFFLGLFVWIIGRSVAIALFLALISLMLRPGFLRKQVPAR